MILLKVKIIKNQIKGLKEKNNKFKPNKIKEKRKNYIFRNKATKSKFK